MRGMNVIGAWLLTLCIISLVSCSEEETCDVQRQPLFGRPSANTGLSQEACSPVCENCEDEGFESKLYAQDFINWLQGLELLNPPQGLTANPYGDAQNALPTDSELACVVQIQSDTTYRLESRGLTAELNPLQEFITHRGECGLCSSLEDLAVYMANPDLTAPVRECGARGFTDGEQAQLECLSEIGFSEPCAQIWLYNIINTRQNCLALCLEYLEEPHHLEDGSLNPCIQCDEDKSGPVFKKVAGRTRRSSGLASGLCRPCESVFPLLHDYGFSQMTR